MIVEQKPDNTLWKAMILGSFVMLSMLTWGMSPLQKLVEKVQHKETIKAKMNVCMEIRSMVPVYEEWTHTLFKSGCMWETRNIAQQVFDPEKYKDILKQFDDGEGLEVDKWLNHCASGASALQKEKKITDRVLTPIYFDKLDCPSIYDEAKKLGIKEEDLEERKSK